MMITRKQLRHILAFCISLILCFCPTQFGYAYSLLTHELLVDILWHDQITPLLVHRFGHLTSKQLADARSYAIGGALIQDAGYYSDVPSEKIFADYTHYIRTGDFVSNLFRNARNANELAFAIGALTHYVGDSVGHPEATNSAVGKMYPELVPDALGRVSYTQQPHRHYSVETGFDVNGVLRHRFPPRQLIRIHYMNVELQQLTYAYFQTYGTLQDMTWSGSQLDLSTYMGSGGSKLPLAVVVLSDMQNDKTPIAEIDSQEMKTYLALLAKVAKDDNWSSYRNSIDLKASLARVGFSFVKNRPNYKDLVDIRKPSDKTQQMYVSSVVHCVEKLNLLLAQMMNGAPIPVMETQRLDATIHPLPNLNLDTGELTKTSEYNLADRAYLQLLMDIVSDSQGVAFSKREKACLPWHVTPQTKLDLHEFLLRPGKLPSPDDNNRYLKLQKVPITEGCPCSQLGDGETGAAGGACLSLPKQP